MLTHDSGLHWNKCLSCYLSHILTCILKKLGKLDYQFVVIFEKQYVVSKLSHQISKLLAHLKPLHVWSASSILDQKNLENLTFLAWCSDSTETIVCFIRNELVCVSCFLAYHFYYLNKEGLHYTFKRGKEVG